MSWNVASSLNPEFVRILRISLPRRRALFIAALVVVLLAAGGWALWQENEAPRYGWQADEWQAHGRQVKDFGNEAFGGLTVALFGLLFVFAPAMAGLSFIQERLRGTAIFQQMTLLSPGRLAAGKFFGSSVMAYFIAAFLLPCALVAAWLGGVDPLKPWNGGLQAHMVLRLYLFLFVGGLCWQAIGLFASSALSGPAEKALRGGLLVGPAIAVGGAVTAIALNQYFTFDPAELIQRYDSEAYYYRHVRSQYFWHFYGAELPAYVVILGLLAFAGAWAFAGAVRRLKVWQLIPVGPGAAWVFFASAEALLVGLLWGRHVDDTAPQERLVVYLLLNWAALALVAGSSALTRGRLREWWSAERDPLAVFRRGEIRNSLRTFLLALGIAEIGLLALWMSYHVHPHGARANAYLSEFVPIALCFALTILGMAAFIQFCAMFRFRIGGWAGVGLTAIFYLFTTVAGLVLGHGEINSTPALLNPLAYVEATTKGDYFMDSRFDARWPEERYSDSSERYPVVEQKMMIPEEYTPNAEPNYDLGDARAHGLVAEALLSLFCFGIAFVKWRRTRREMLAGGADA